MKRIGVLLLIFVLLGVVAFSVSAAGSSVSLTPSATTLHRGDTFTIVADLTNSDEINLATVVLSYDETVFELTGGTCHVAGANPAQIVVPQKAGTFFLGTASAVSGKIFTFNFKVKDTASFGTYTFTPSAAIGTSGGNMISATGTSVTIACKHGYGNWTDAGNGKHSKTCSICQDVQTVDHTWNSGTVTKPASCKEAGVKTFACTACQATKTEDIAKTTTHSYGSWTDLGNGSHKHTCSVCQKEETAAHSWNSGTVTKPASCKEAGIKTFACTACQATKTENIAKTTTHSYGSWTKVDDSTHKHVCSVCSKEENANHTWNSGVVTKKATCKESGIKTYTCSSCSATKTETIAKLTTHTYDNNCDTNCNVCGLTRTITHSYKTTWSKDGSNHWYECSVCKDKKEIAAHTPGADATETTAQTCTTCGYIIKAALGHTHNFATSWTTDNAGHWYACAGCEEKGSYMAHDFENLCDKDCSVCDFTRETSHAFEENWKNDVNNHWHECANCGEKSDEAAHTPGAEATATTAQTCTACGYEIAPALGVPETEPVITPNDNNDAKEFPIWIPIVAIVVIGGIGAAVVLLKKKR